LITFQSTANVSQKITHAIENFRHKVNGMNAHGDTSLWDALTLASDQIIDYTKRFPNAKRRIICLSDGKDNMSKQKVGDLSLFLSVSYQVSIDTLIRVTADEIAKQHRGRFVLPGR
jgi:Mg-chelatase subunit ChlD